MKSTVHITIYFLIFIVLLSCKKDTVPKDSETTPVFSFSGEINGQLVTILAGKNDYYMYSSKSVDVNNIKSFSANLTQTTNQNGPNSLKITFIDYASSNLIPTSIDSSLYVGYYNYATTTGKASRYNVSFTKNTLGPLVTGVNWTFGDGNSIMELNPSHTYVRPGKYYYCTEAEFNGGCSSSICNSISLGNIGAFCETNMAISNPVGTTFNFTSNGNLGIGPYSYFWDFGDGNTSIDQNVQHTYSNEGVFTVSLTVTDSEGTTETKRENIRTANSTVCVVRHAHSISPIANPLNLGNVVIEWTDASGLIYTSKNDNQSQRSFFKILNVEDYSVNEKGEPTKKINVTFSCTLFNGNQSIELKNCTAVIAVSY
jgi:PKD repeat protein